MDDHLAEGHLEVLAQRLTVAVREALQYLVDTGASRRELAIFVETFERDFRNNLREALFSD